MHNPTERRTLAAFLREQGLGEIAVDDVWVDRRQRPSALCYIFDGESMLLLKRNNPPFTGYWTAPGGKLIPGESPVDGVIREIREETALHLREPRLRFIASEIGEKDEFCWLLFGFVARRWTGNLGTTPEGELAWLSPEELKAAPVPEVDRALFPHVSEPDRNQVYVAHIRFALDGGLEALKIDEVRVGEA